MAGTPSRFLSLIHRRPFSLFRSTRRHSLTTLSTATNHHLLRLTLSTPIKFNHSFHSTPTFSLPVNYHNAGYHVQPSHPWPEWFRLLESLSLAGYFNPNVNNIEDEFIVNENLPTEFVNAANLCLAFARDRPDILRWLPRKDIEVVIDNGYPFLFKTGEETERKIRAFLQAVGFNEATLVDLMKYILSYASNPVIYPERKIKEAVESSVRNMLQEMANMIDSSQGQMPRNLGPNITMKKGDWICSKCSFMNFARNTQCLECEELRPQRQLTGGEWDCPRCNFFNYRKNTVCLKCDCRRPDESQVHTSETSNISAQSSPIQKTEKEERTERWFKKVKELHGVTDPTGSSSNHDLQQITRIPNAENHFVDNMNKDRLSSHHQGSTNGFVPFPPNYFANNNNVQQQPKNIDSAANSISGNFYSNNEILDKNMNLDSRSSFGNRIVFRGDTDNTHLSSNQFRRNEPIPEGNRTMFSRDMDTVISNDPFRRNEPKPEFNRTSFSQDMDTESSRNQFRRHEPGPETGQRAPESMNPKSGCAGKSLEGSAVTEADPLDMSEEAKAERWFRRVAQIKDISELSQIPDEDFPSIMPMRKGVNRFVVSKRKTPLERRLTSPQYRKNLRIMSSDSMKNEGNDD